MTFQPAIDLRPYQLDAIDQMRSRISQGKRRIVLVMPTGGGKTVVASAMIHSALKRGSRCLFLAHRKELIDQTVDKLSRWDVAAGVIMAQDRRRDDYQAVQVASVQTLARRLSRLPKANLVIVDECHHATSKTYRSVIDAYPESVVIGLTATPWRTDKMGLSDIYEDHVLATTPGQLMASGALVNYDAYGYDSPDLHEVPLVAGEYNQRQLAIACNTSVLVGSVVREYLAHAAPRRAILFPVNIEHSKNLVAQFRSAGIVAEHVDCDTPRDVRATAMARFRGGDLTILSSVGVLTEGFDAPAAEVCILARPTKSLTLHLQMIGRVLRPSPETGKQKALIHDHAGNLMRHGFPDDERDYSPRATPERVKKINTCPVCKKMFQPGSIKADGTCPECGALIAPPAKCQWCDKKIFQGEHPPEPEAGEEDEWCRCEKTSHKEKEVVEGTRVTKEQIQEMRARRKEQGIERELSDRQLAKAAAATIEEKIAEYKRLLLVCERKGFKEGFAKHKYREIWGVWPRFNNQALFDSVLAAERPFIPLPKRSHLVHTCPHCLEPFRCLGSSGECPHCGVVLEAA